MGNPKPFSQKALTLFQSSISAQPNDEQETEGSGSQLVKQHEAMEAKLNPEVVAMGNWNPLSIESKLARKAKKEAFYARLAIFRDNVEAIRKANRVMNNAAVIKIVTAAEAFIVDVRSQIEVTKQRILADAQRDLLDNLNVSLEELERYRSTLVEDFVEPMAEKLCNDFAERVHKIGGFDFEFDKSELLRLDLSALPS
jgi:hypothetical protein